MENWGEKLEALEQKTGKREMEGETVKFRRESGGVGAETGKLGTDGETEKVRRESGGGGAEVGKPGMEKQRRSGVEPGRRKMGDQEIGEVRKASWEKKAGRSGGQEWSWGRKLGGGESERLEKPAASQRKAKERERELGRKRWSGRGDGQWTKKPSAGRQPGGRGNWEVDAEIKVSRKLGELGETARGWRQKWR